MNLITRSDFDGLVCATLLREVEILDEVRFAHPRDIQDGAVEVGRADILTNLPYDPRCGMWFDHHSSEVLREDIPASFEGRVEVAPSCARVIANHYGSARFERLEALLFFVDKVDSANLTQEEVLNPTGWILIGFLCDPRTGLGKFHDYVISNRDLMTRLISLFGTHSANEILRMRDVRERADRYFELQAEHLAMLRERARQEGNAIVLDTRGMKEIPPGNRFLLYTMFPTANISLHIMDGKLGHNVAVAIGHSIFNRTSETNVGVLCADYGSGGHRGAGTVQFETDGAEAKIRDIVARVKADG